MKDEKAKGEKMDAEKVNVLGKPTTRLRSYNCHLFAQLQKALSGARVEKDIENTYRRLFHIAFPDAEITSPHGCDGLLKSVAHDLVALMEFKFNFDFKKRWVVCEVLTQCLFYLKRFEQAGDSIPKVLFVGDIDECFCVAVSPLEKYLASKEIDWSSAPSSSALLNPKLVKSLHEDEAVVPYVCDLAGFNFNRVVDMMLDLNQGIVRHVVITEANVSRIFDDFCARVVTDARYKDKGKDAEKKSNELVGIFLGILTQPDQFYKHPVLKNTLVTPTVGTLKVDHKAFVTFFGHFQGEYGPAERQRLVSVCDRLIEDTKRRWDGAFFTPTHWVDESHRMIERQLGENWKEEYVVWECCWGTGNLTRDYRFKELYCSTLIPDELQLGSHYNPEAVKFVYDFLSEVGLDKLPKEAEGLKKAFAEGRKVVFLVNPPYGKATSKDLRGGGGKTKGMAKNALNILMLKEGQGLAAAQLYTQFFYKIGKLGGTAAIFAPPMFLTSGSFKAFRRFWLEQYNCSEGMLFQASEFADVAGRWGIMFSVWQRGQDDRTEWTVVLKRSSEDLENPIETFGEKVLYNLDGKAPAHKWLKGGTVKLAKDVVPNLASALTVADADKKGIVQQLGCMNNHTNVVYKNGTDVYLLSSTGTGNANVPVIPANFRKCCALFTARRTITGKFVTWVNQKDEYQAPNEQHPDYAQWNTDAIVYSLFNTASNQSSLRNISYKGKTWQIHNEWFWLSRKTILDLANKHHNDAVYQDARTDKDRFVYTTLQSTSLSPDAKAVLDKATELLEKTFEYRELAADEHPEWCINAWDTGYYQLKLLLKQYIPGELKAFRELYKVLENRLREGVYDLGFLRR